MTELHAGVRAALLAGAPADSTHHLGDDFDTINRVYLERGWGDGLPIVPPTVERVGAMLAYCARPWNTPIATVAPRWGEATPLRLAANAVMAGCKPEYFPLVLLAVEALCAEPFNLYGVQTTTHQVAPLLIFNGPIARELGINGGFNAFGPGWQANATIGRAIRLVLLNIGGALPGTGDMATFGSPAKFSYCVAENEAASPWVPLHVERGFAADTTTVTVLGCEGPHNISEHETATAAGLLRAIVHTMAIPGANNATQSKGEFAGEPMLVLCPEHAALLAAGGYDKAALRAHLWQHARVPVAHYSPESIARRFADSDRFADQQHLPLLERKVPIAQCADDILILVLGGAGKHSAYIPNFGVTRSVTLALEQGDGTPVHRIDELRAA